MGRQDRARRTTPGPQRVTPEDRQRAIAEYREGVLRDVERLKSQRKMLDRTSEMIEDEIEALIEASTQFSMDALPTADAPPLLAAILRAELARAIAHARRAGRCARRMHIDTSALSAALASLSATAQSLPADLPKTYRRLP
jgi:hypothetical protein